ncbi:tripartite tricarboxylate transporter TctB family protein [Psychromarinibacter sp. C21-152]|uniref:Tripartite tricarboxylate transporter TctB family protein n=1 Tax=Psychromarinibacter sediminicola TaxID=3033385 RepID=A0AAE3NSU5_9RHOB|nr:tripartite tricarboxylate transporter TctB family protein [Psychromarinibacter sediminicola]MDF0601381.1 tripartite tricarboxylate transporter TctB family protein [Psychromarinibacter sediminicola]
MTVDRLLGALVAGFGVVLLFVLIPAHVQARPGEPVDPSLFPRIAAWMLMLLGGLQMVFPGGGTTVPPPRDIGRLALAVAMLVAAALVLRVIGFIPTAILLMGTTVLLIHERRPLWAVLSVLAVPVLVWALFELVLQRPLP